MMMTMMMTMMMMTMVMMLLIYSLKVVGAQRGSVLNSLVARQRRASGPENEQQHPTTTDSNLQQPTKANNSQQQQAMITSKLLNVELSTLTTPRVAVVSQWGGGGSVCLWTVNFDGAEGYGGVAILWL